MKVIEIYLAIISIYCLVSTIRHLISLFGFSLKLERQEPPTPNVAPQPPQPQRSIMGASNSTILHPTPPRDTERQSVEAKSNSSTSETKRDADIDKGRVQENQMDLDLESEAEGEEAAGEYDPAMQASGVELSQIQDAIATLQDRKSTLKDMRIAGEIFSRLEGSEIIDQITNNEESKKRIAKMLDYHQRAGSETMANENIELSAAAEKFNIDDYI
ncbi:MAG: hypothetical protein SNF68_07370 [Rikenellaceae bacterium]